GQVTWTGSDAVPCCNQWITLPKSQLQAATGGGAVLVYMHLSMINGSHATCQPTVDGKWAGSYGNLAFTGDPAWKEGLLCVGACGGGWRMWAPTRLYPAIPPGQHTFAVQCSTDGGTLTVGDPSAGSSFGFVELP